MENTYNSDSAYEYSYMDDMNGGYGRVAANLFQPQYLCMHSMKNICYLYKNGLQ